MKIAGDMVEASVVIPAMVAVANVAKQGNPSIVDVRIVAPELAKKMEDLGYIELTKELVAAFRMHGIIQEPPLSELCLFSGEMTGRFVNDG